MKGCKFCELDKSIYYNKAIEETKNFLVVPALGALVEGYVMIVSKEHANSIIELDNDVLKEYNELIEKYRDLYKDFYGKYPIVFEHGTPDINGLCTSCVTHAHSHIVNHNYKDEDEIIKNLNFERINSIDDIKNQNYIFYQNPLGEKFVTYKYKPERQMMRQLIAKDLGLAEKYNWREYPFYENINKTINKFQSL